MGSVWDDMDRVVDSPDPSVREHVNRYLATGGESGYMEGGMTNLLLTTVGRRSGRLRRTGLFFGVDGDRYVLVGSHWSGREPEHPGWYLNLVEHPEVHVQVKGERFLARARAAEGEERARLWRMMTDRVPDYVVYQARATREFPIVVLERVD
jgi:deazaflavin-dependent oxidoreductase (nitroreductase family)